MKAWLVRYAVQRILRDGLQGLIEMVAWCLGITAALLVLTIGLSTGWLVGAAMQPGGIGWINAQGKGVVFDPAGKAIVPVRDVPGPGEIPVEAPPLGPTAVDGTLLGRLIQPWLTVPYLFGGCSLRGVDCSCFTRSVAAQMGVTLPRVAQDQWNATTRVSTPEVGDLVFFAHTYDAGPGQPITHVGWYVGSGMMVSAIEPAVGRQSLDGAYWKSHLVGYGRLRAQQPPNQALEVSAWMQ